MTSEEVNILMALATEEPGWQFSILRLEKLTGYSFWVIFDTLDCLIGNGKVISQMHGYSLPPNPAR